MKKVVYRNAIDALLGILPSDVTKFDRKQHSRTRPPSLRRRKKASRASRKRNRT